jgi:hypothetical protein
MKLPKVAKCTLRCTELDILEGEFVLHTTARIESWPLYCSVVENDFHIKLNGPGSSLSTKYGRFNSKNNHKTIKRIYLISLNE